MQVEEEEEEEAEGAERVASQREGEGVIGGVLDRKGPTRRRMWNEAKLLKTRTSSTSGKEENTNREILV